MRIKSLQVHGFKSFVDRTAFRFREGITAVVGPNGCGKSNVVDAVRWVMGEQSPRRLRGKGMEDVIFAGSETRPPIGMAEVELVFDNADGTAPAEYGAYGEIQITRRLYRSGESEYLINKVPCRLRDVQDFFRDTGIGTKGYTIVEQGRIAEIVSAKPEDRRVLIEEAAGISKYKARRREAESKMASTEQNLVRVNDVLGEIRRQIASLERQARKAARYKRLSETLRVLELSLSADERSDLEAERAAAATALGHLREEVAGLEARVSQRELAVEERRIALAEAEKEVASGAERLYGLRSEIKQLEGRIELARREREGLAEANAGRREEIEQLVSQREAAERESAQQRDELARLEDALAGEAEALRAAEEDVRGAREAVRGVEREREEANERLVGVLTGIARLEDRFAALQERGAALDRRVRGTDRELELQQSEAMQAGRDQTSLEDGLRNLLSERDRLQESLLGGLKRAEQRAEAAREAAERLQALRERHEARRARCDSLREVLERHEDLGEGTRQLLSRGEEARHRFGLRGLVRELLEADAEVERAVEAVLAERSQALVAESAAGAVDALDALREGRSGRASFVVEPQDRPVPTGIVPLGQPLLERVRARAGGEALARSLLGDVYLVGSLREALGVYGSGRLPATFVTPEGDMLTPDGLVSGGASRGGESAAGSVLGRSREVRELAAEVERLAALVAEAEQSQRAAEAERLEAAEELDNLRNRHHTAVLAVANHEKDLERTRERVKALGEAHEGRVAERSELLAEGEALELEQRRLEGELEERRAERSGRQREIDEWNGRVHAAARELTRLESRVTEVRVAHDARVEKRDRLAQSAERAGQAARETGSWIERREREIAAAEERRTALAEEVTGAEQALAGKLAEEEAARVDAEAHRERFESMAQALRELEGEVREARSRLGEHRERAGEAELAVREHDLRLRHLDDSVREKWGVELAGWSPPPLEPGDEGEDDAAARDEGEAAEDEEAGEVGDSAQALRDARRNARMARMPREERQQELERARGQLQSLGDVNLGAIEEHEELAERFRFLSEQRADLEATIESLREAIARINRTSRRRFRETFEAVSKCFSENFPRLFGGGKASLTLTETEDVLEAGIDIMAMPPGKRLQNVNLLSGGEKTMTAIALLVAVFQVRPSPFFLLDEVDAALDDVNVGRFNQLIRELARESQFLVITHNKQTIEVADVLYGVTMEQRGVSKLVAVELR